MTKKKYFSCPNCGSPNQPAFEIVDRVAAYSLTEKILIRHVEVLKCKTCGHTFFDDKLAKAYSKQLADAIWEMNELKATSA